MLDVDLIDDTKDDSLEKYQGQWMNLTFRKDGLCIKGSNRYNTEEEARKYIEWVLSGANTPKNVQIFTGNGSTGLVTYDRNKHIIVYVPPNSIREVDFAYSLQLPAA